MRPLFFFVFCILPTFAQSTGTPEAANPFDGQTVAIEAGQKRFREGCAACHGANAEGGRGPNLAENQDLKRKTDEQLFKIIRYGIPKAGMPASPLPDNSIWELAAFVRSLSAPAYELPMPGNLEDGHTLYWGKGECGSCHAIRGEGGFTGPDLTNIGATRTAKQLTEGVLHPDQHPVEGFRGVTVVLKDGQRIEGVAKNHSNYSLQVLDSAGALHLLQRSDIRQVEFHQKSLMPNNYGQTLSPEELQDLLAFLSRQAVRMERKKARPVSRRSAEN
jgi:putative heme-binding domain-containing protein